MKKIKNIIFGALAALIVAPAAVFAQAPGGISNGVGDAIGDSDLRDSDLTDFLSDVLSWLLYFIGFLSVIMIVVAGIMYVTSGGDEEQVGKAKKTLVYSIVGLLVALLGLILVRTVLQVAN